MSLHSLELGSQDVGSLGRGLRGPLGFSFALALAALVLTLAIPASATSVHHWQPDHRSPSKPDTGHHWRPPVHPPNLPGFSLARLIEGGGSFTSNNGKVTFGDFDAVAGGIAVEDFRFYRVVPLGDGFRLMTPLLALLGHDASLELSYSVEAADGLLIDAVHLSFHSAAILAKASVDMDLYDEGDQLAHLRVWDRGFFHPGGKKHDRQRLSPAVPGFDVEELIKLRAGLIAATRSVDHHFKTAPVPEPTTALLMGLGLAGLALSGRRRRS